MLRFLKRHRETLLITLLGLVIFGALNWMMVCVDPERFTNPRYGSYSAFSNLTVSGFDFYTYSVVTLWNPRYALYRHPLLAVFIWPLSELNKGLKDVFGINCAIYIIGVVWTMVSTLAWVCLYKIMRKAVGSSWSSSLLYCLLFFSFSHVMITTFFPDHMLLTMCTLLLSVYVISTARKNVPIWKTLLLYFAGTGITTTNSVKIWLMDQVGSWFLVQGSRFKCCFRRSLWFLIPTVILFGCYYWQLNNSQAHFQKSQAHMIATKLKTDTAFAKRQEASKVQDAKKKQDRKNKQISSSKLFDYTDTSIGRFTLLYENVFGEGLLLHDTHTLEDPGAFSEPIRPVIVRYTRWWYYAITEIIVILGIWGLWSGRRKRIMWIVLMPFLFDMLLHVGLCFAALDVYIMTAHWAFVLPVGIALLDKSIEKKKAVSWLLRGTVFVLTAFLWVHNLSLTVNHLAQF